MARPKGGYKIDGVRVPGCTTIAKLTANQDALIGWANKIGREHGVTTHEFLQKAQDAGTLAHEMVESWLRESHGLEPLKPSEGLLSNPVLVEMAEMALSAFKRWAEAYDLEILALEESLVSEKHQFGGTTDIRCNIQGEHSILDLKTSNTGPYPEWLYQCAGYKILTEENHPELPPIERVALIRIGKEDCSFHHSDWGKALIEDAVGAFLCFREAYRWKQRVEKRGRL